MPTNTTCTGHASADEAKPAPANPTMSAEDTTPRCDRRLPARTCGPGLRRPSHGCSRRTSGQSVPKGCPANDLLRVEGCSGLIGGTFPYPVRTRLCRRATPRMAWWTPSPLRRQPRRIFQPFIRAKAPPHHPRERRPRFPHRTTPGPKSTRTGLTLYQVLDALQDVLRCWTGTCTTCHQPLPRRTHSTPRSTQT